MDTVFNSVISTGISVGIKLIIAVVVMLITFRIITVVSRKIVGKASKKLDKTLTKTLVYVAAVMLRCVVVICLVGYLGIDTTGLSALVASLGVCVGLAVNGALGNIAGGILILITRPFKVDDHVEIAGISGIVEDILLTLTKIRTWDNKTVYIPNSTVSSSSIVNHSEKKLRRVDIKFPISYSMDYKKAEKTVLDVLSSHPLILGDPPPTVRISKFGDSSVEIVSKAWCNTSDYWKVYYDLLENVKTAFDEAGIEIPFNQIDVHIKNDK